MSEVTTGPISNTSSRRRQWPSFVFDAFVEDLKQSRLVIDPPSHVTEMFDCYDATVIELLDNMRRGVQLKRGSVSLHPGSTPSVILQN